MSHRKPSWTYYYPRERDATIGFPKSSKRCRATVLLLLIMCCTTLRATIASALAGRRSPLHRTTTTTTAAAHGRPPADTQTKTEKRGTKSSAPIALSFIHDWDTSVDNQSLNWEEYYWWYIISWDFKLCQKVMCTSNSIQKSWQLSKPSDHDEAWNLSLPPQKTNHWIQNPPKMGLERILGWTILALMIANCQGKMTYF